MSTFNKLIQERPLNSRVVMYRQLMFFKYLAISPSYNLAHKFRTKKNKINPKEIPLDFEKVLEIYDLAGDVWSIEFNRWWIKTGQDLFKEDNTKQNFIFRINFDKENIQIKKDFSKYLDLLTKKNFKPNNPKIQLLKNKVRNVTLNDRLSIIETISKNSSSGNLKKENSSPNIPYWRLALNLKYDFNFLPFFKHNKHLKQIIIDEKKGRSNKKRKAYITMLISKFIKEGLNISENAARGQFPTTKNSINFLKFDFESLSKVLYKKNGILHENLLNDKYESIPIQFEPYKLNSFYHRIENYQSIEFKKKYTAKLKKYAQAVYKQLYREDGKADLSEIRKLKKTLRNAKSYISDPPDFLKDNSK